LTDARPQILVTNDDGADSPILVPLLRALSPLAQICTVVPAAECSWTSKIVSRFAPLDLAEIDREGFAVQTVAGYPADCANIGIHNLCPTPPALVVSGINMGTNAGLAFALSSGTIGAAVEGFLSGIAAAAFSLELPKAAFALWRRERLVDPALVGLMEAAAAVTAEIVGELLRGGLPESADIVTVNMPASTSRESPRRLTGMARSQYGGLFTRHESESHFAYAGCELLPVGDQADSDLLALAQGEIAITPLRYALGAPVRAADRRRFERGI
jgi:5'-nucleotidase